MTMIEKVARAIARAQYGDHDVDLDQPAYRYNMETRTPEPQTFPVWHEFIPEARAALEAIADPSEAMYAAGQDALQEGRAADEIFRRMIAKGMDQP